MGAATKTRPLPPPVADAESWEQIDWLAPVGIAAIDKLASEHHSAVVRWREDVAHIVDLQTQAEQEAREWRRSVRLAVAEGRKPPARSIDDDVKRAQIEVAQEDA